MTINGPKIYFTIPIFGGIAVTQTLVTSLVATILICVAAVLLGRNLKKRPGRAQVLTEKAVSVITNMVSEAMGAHNVRWTPFIAAVFFSSLVGTLLGMTGILRSSTADISTTMTWAVLVSILCWYESIKNNGFLGWLKGFTEPIAVMTPMNIVSEIAQPVSLAFRHFGNIAGGGVITALIYWALSGASAGILRAIASGTVLVPVFLLVAGLLLVLLLPRAVKNKKLLVLVYFVGVACLALAGLRFADLLWSLTGRAYPEMNGPVTGLCWFGALAVLLAGVVLLIGHRTKGKTILGIVLAALGFLGICFVSEGPMGVPVLTLGLPAVLSLYFDVFAGVIQAFVFSLLTMIYISSNCPPPEENKTESQ